MLNYIAAVATIAVVIGTLAPALADGTTTFTLSPAKLAYNSVPLRSSETDAKIVSIGSVDIPAPENFYERGDHATISIDLSADAVVTRATLSQTCGYYRVDQIALKAVRDATYQAATIDGKPVAGHYQVDVNLEGSSN